MVIGIDSFCAANCDIRCIGTSLCEMHFECNMIGIAEPHILLREMLRVLASSMRINIINISETLHTAFSLSGNRISLSDHFNYQHSHNVLLTFSQNQMRNSNDLLHQYHS